MSMWRAWPRSTKALAVLIASGIIACAVAIIPSPANLIEQFATPVAPKIAVPKIVALPAPLPLDAYAQIAARPLFNPGRKPDPAAPLPQQPKPAVTLGDLSQLKLVGIVTSGATKLALVRRAGAATLTLRVGDSLDGWTVEQISVQGVGLRGGDRQESIKIPAAENRAPARTNIRADGE